MKRSSLSRLCLALAVSPWACATPTQDSRSFERPEFKQLQVRSLEVVLTVAGPPLASPPPFQVPTFEVPNWSTVLRAPEEESATRDALVQALFQQLSSQGYEVTVRHAGFGAEPPAAEGAGPGELRVVSQPPVETSTAPASSTGSSTVRVSQPPPPALASPSPVNESLLAEGTTLKQVLESSKADAVLVVRCVVVDSFYFLEGAGQAVVLQGTDVGGAGGVQPLTQARAKLRSGRLLVGQAFIFDRQTGVRLWSRQLPDMPEDGRLNADSKLLKYGVVTPLDGPELMPADKAAQAAPRFAAAMFEGLPGPTDGSQAARDKLAQVDVEQEQARQSFLDYSHFVLQLDTSWSLETAGLGVTLDETALDDLGAGAIAPQGVLRFTPRVGFQSAGGLIVSVGVPIGFAPNDFQRSYYRDNPRPDMSDPHNRGVAVQIGRPTLGGLEMGGGYALVLTPRLLARAEGGVFGEVWTFDATPTGVLSGNRIYRFGVYGGAQLALRLTEGGRLFAHTGVRGRLGGATQGPFVLGLDVQLGLGLFL